MRDDIAANFDFSARQLAHAAANSRSLGEGAQATLKEAT